VNSTPLAVCVLGDNLLRVCITPRHTTDGADKVFVCRLQDGALATLVVRVRSCMTEVSFDRHVGQYIGALGMLCACARRLRTGSGSADVGGWMLPCTLPGIGVGPQTFPGVLGDATDCEPAALSML
jgi:hypothetical protein